MERLRCGCPKRPASKGSLFGIGVTPGVTRHDVGDVWLAVCVSFGTAALLALLSLIDVYWPSGVLGRAAVVAFAAGVPLQLIGAGVLRASASLQHRLACLALCAVGALGTAAPLAVSWFGPRWAISGPGWPGLSLLCSLPAPVYAALLDQLLAEAWKRVERNAGG